MQFWFQLMRITLLPRLRMPLLEDTEVQYQNEDQHQHSQSHHKHTHSNNGQRHSTAPLEDAGLLDTCIWEYTEN